MQKESIMLTVFFFICLIVLFSEINSNLWIAGVMIAILQGAWIWSKSK